MTNESQLVPTLEQDPMNLRDICGKAVTKLIRKMPQGVSFTLHLVHQTTPSTADGTAEFKLVSGGTTPPAVQLALNPTVVKILNQQAEEEARLVQTVKVDDVSMEDMMLKALPNTL